MWLCTDGELGRFLELVYKIKSDNRTAEIWAPYDAIEAAFDASPTLDAMPGLRDAVIHTYWFEEGNTSIIGDFLGWILRPALESTGNFKSEQNMDQVFSKVNAELEEAFASGKLEKDTRIQLVSSAGGAHRSGNCGAGR